MNEKMNFKVKLIGYNRNERTFTLGKIYEVNNGHIVNDNGFDYGGVAYNSEGVINYLKRWYEFKIVEDTRPNLKNNKNENNEPIICDHCGCVIEDNNYIEFDGKIFCEDCKDSELDICEDCGNYCYRDELYWLDNYDKVICQNCRDNDYYECADCGELVYQWDIFYNDCDEPICENCAENYTQCSDCGCVIHIDNCYYDEDEDRDYCEHCFHNNSNKTIHNYNYKPYPIFYHCDNEDNQLYMGIELEIDEGGEDYDNAQKVLDVGNMENEHIYIKHDGSLNDGFEIVSHPATLDYHINNMQWEKIMDIAKDMGYRSHDTQTCGLHIHISRKALGIDEDKQEETIAKIVYFVEQNWDNILTFTRRNEENLARWASRYGIEPTIRDTYDKAKGSYDRYKCINLQNYNTVEFRMFRGTLKYSTFVATLQLVNKIVNWCIALTDEELNKTNWLDFVSDIDTDKNADLVEYLKLKELYI